MATRTWSGANGSFADPTNWSGGVVPTTGDTAVINSGTVTAGNLTFVGLGVDLNGSAAVAGSLALANSTIDSASTLTINDQNTYGASPTAALAIQGVVTNNGTMLFQGTTSTVSFDVSAALVNNGLIAIAGASPQVAYGNGAAAGSIVNDGTFRVTNTGNTYQSPVFNTTFSGTGSIELSVNGKLDIRQGVGSGQTVAFTGGVNAGSALQIDSPSAFQANVTGFVSGDRLILTNIPYTSYSYTPTSGSSGTLTITGGGGTQASINLTGIYSQGTFNVTASPLGTTGNYNLNIATSVLNAATGSTTSAGAGPVYRFFDKTTGTHFFTSDTSERDNILDTLSQRYTEETNNFGTGQQSDPSAVLVYRFFDTKFGTHFYTSSASEFAGLTTPGTSTYRPDLTYEAGGDFYEHSSPQAGDVQVYRFFDTKFGTHFYTGDPNEFAAITTPGTATYRPDLTYEPGGNFYAPAGTFT